VSRGWYSPYVLRDRRVEFAYLGIVMPWVVHAWMGGHSLTMYDSLNNIIELFQGKSSCRFSPVDAVTSQL